MQDLNLLGTGVTDLEPLRGMPLKFLWLNETPVSDLTPLKGLSLKRLIFTPGRITKGLEIIREMKSIREIGPSFENRMNPSQFWNLYSEGKFK